VLDNRTVHIDHVESTIGTQFHVDRFKPLIPGGQEFDPFTTPTASKRPTPRCHDFSVDQAAGRVTGKDVATELLGQTASAVTEDATSGSELSGMQRRGCPGAGNWKDPGSLSGLGRIVKDSRDGRLRRSPQVSILENDMFGRITIAADKAIAIVIKRESKLPNPGNSFVMKRLGVETKVHVIDIHLRAIWLASILDHATPQAVGNVDMVVEAKAGVIGPQLRIIFNKTPVPSLPQVSAAVSSRILEISDLPGHGHDHASLPRLYPSRKEETISKDPGGFKKTVAIFVGQDTQLALGQFTLLGTPRIVAHFNDPHSTASIKTKSYRIRHLWLSSNQFSSQARRQLKMRKGILRSHGGTGWLGCPRGKAAQAGNDKNNCPTSSGQRIQVRGLLTILCKRYQ